MRSAVFDTETTGLIDNIGRPLAKQPYTIEFFGVVVDHDTLEMTECYGTLVKPPITITDTITSITGVTNEMVKDAPTMSFVLPKIVDFLGSCDRIVAHNAGYDRDIIDIEMQRVGQTMKWPEVICTVEATEWLKGYRLKLGDLHLELFGADFADHHRAEPDTRALARCYIEMLKRGWV